MNPDAAVTVLIEIHAEPGREREAREALLRAIETSAKPGLLSSTEYEDTDDPGAFYAVQEWADAESFRAHMDDAAASGMDEAVASLRQAPRTTMLRAIS